MMGLHAPRTNLFFNLMIHKSQSASDGSLK
jgi:hypothetical protein